MLTERQKTILARLLEAGKDVTTGDLAMLLKVSDKTVRSDLDELSETLGGQQGIRILRKPGVGVCLTVEPGRHATLNALLLSDNIGLGGFDNRRHYILRRVLFLKYGQAVTETSLAQELLISRSGIQKDIEVISQWLQRFDISLVKRKNRGLILDGSEFDRRIATTKLFFAMAPTTDPVSRVINGRLTEEQDIALRQLLPHFDYRPVVEMIEELEHGSDHTMDHDSFTTLLLYCAIDIYRYREGFHIMLNGEQQRQMEQIPLPNEIERLHRAVMLRYSVNLPAEELFYLFMYVLASGVCDGEMVNVQRAEIISSNKFKQFSWELLQTIQNILEINLQNEAALVKNITFHLSGVICRLKCGIRIQNPLLQDVKETYPRFFGAAWATSVLFDKHYNLAVSDDEIGFLAMYIGTAAQSLRRSISVCVVCNYGMSVSGLISERLHRKIPELEIKDVLSTDKFYRLRKGNLKTWDLVITTVDCTEAVLPMVKVDSVLKNGDIQHVLEKVEQIYRQRSYTQMPERDREALCKPELVFINLVTTNKNDCILHLCDQLVQQGCVTAAFTASVMERERTISTEVGSGVAIPHGNPKHVLQSAVAVAMLHSPIMWSGESVDVVFLIAIATKQLESHPSIPREFYRTLALLLDSPKMQKELRGLTSPKLVCDYLNDNRKFTFL